MGKRRHIFSKVTLYALISGLLTSCGTTTNSSLMLPQSSGISTQVSGAVMTGQVQLDQTLPESYATQWLIQLPDSEHTPDQLTINGSRFTPIQKSQAGSTLFAVSLESAFDQWDSTQQLSVPELTQGELQITPLYGSLDPSIESWTYSSLIFLNDPTEVSIVDLALVLALIQIDPDTAANLASRANELLDATLVEPTDLNPIPNDSNADFVNSGVGVNSVDVAAVLARIQVGSNDRTAIADRINSLLDSPGLISSSDIISVPGEISPSPSPSPTIAANDFRIGSSSIAYLDNEFWSDGNKMVWLEFVEPPPLSGFDVYITDLDPNTGQMIPPDGRGQLVDQALFLTNGPEWGISAQGAAIYYTALDNAFIPQVFQANATNPVPTQLTSTAVGKALSTASTTPTFPETLLIFFQFTGLFDTDVIIQSGLTPINILPFTSVGSSGPRWIPNERSLLSRARSSGTQQVVRFDLDTEAVTFLTTDSGDKGDAFIIAAPEFEADPILLTVVDVTSLGLYRQDGDQWTRFNTINLPFNGNPANVDTTFLFGPTLFSFKGKSYVAVAATQDNICTTITCDSISPNQVTHSEIWLTSIDGTIQFEISEDSVQSRVDPEVYVTDSQLYVSYYTLEGELRMINVTLPDFR